jgi:hypothetical protein
MIVIDFFMALIKSIGLVYNSKDTSNCLHLFLFLILY